jgi:hypothetical protein
MQTERQRQWIVVLLAFSCLFALVLLWKSEPPVYKKITSPAQLDSLIQLTLSEMDVRSSQVRHRTIQVDSLFSRGVYHVNVAPNFSKTTLHYTLQQKAWPYGVTSLAKVEFPDRNMHIHLLVNDNIHRSVVIREDTALRLQQNQPEVLPGQDSHEVD